MSYTTLIDFTDDSLIIYGTVIKRDDKILVNNKHVLSVRPDDYGCEIRATTCDETGSAGKIIETDNGYAFRGSIAGEHTRFPIESVEVVERD